MEGAYAKTVDDVLAHFGVSRSAGLTKVQVVESRKRYGPNALPPEPTRSIYALILDQFKDQLVLILLLAAAISFVLAFLDLQDGDVSGSDLFTAFVEPGVILVILIANATVGVIQETSAEKAIEALKEYAPEEAMVLREGSVKRVKTEELVPGDVVELSVGDKVPADCRLMELKSAVLRVDQAILTGESVSVIKDTAPITDERAVKQDMVNILFSGTVVTMGKAKAIVVQTGIHTAIGGIHESIATTDSARTPLQAKLDDFGNLLAKVIGVICVLVWVINIRHFADASHNGWMKGAVYYFKIAVALAVAAIPEGLAVVITTCLALGTKKMAKRNAIVRSLPSVETLGCTNVICSDKTGTLTTNQMCVKRVAFMNESGRASLAELHVGGSDFSPVGSVSRGPNVSQLLEPFTAARQHLAIAQLAAICSQCNDSQIKFDPHSKHWHHLGEPTEAALKVLVEKLGTPEESYNDGIDHRRAADHARISDMVVNDWYDRHYDRVRTLEFSRDRKSMGVLVKPAADDTPSSIRNGDWNVLDVPLRLMVKGAPESVLERCEHVMDASGKVASMTPNMRAAILAKVNDYANHHALRVLACAYKDDSPLLRSLEKDDHLLSDPTQYVNYEGELTFVGLVGMQDPPRPEVKRSVEQCAQAGIRVVVITGDNKNTAEALCRAIGIFAEDEELSGKSFTGREFEALSLVEKRECIEHANLFSRVEPKHKSQLVDLLQKAGLVVAMTGDGVNDAPALRKANIGVAMGTGTDVAKLAGDMVLADDNFATIVAAVEEGRAIYANTKQFIRYLISSNIGEVVCIFLTVLLGMPEVLIPVQLLWVNLVTDGLPATALGFNPADSDVMHQPPRSSRDRLVDGWLLFRYCAVGAYVGVATVLGYAWWFVSYSGGPQISWWQLTNFHRCGADSDVFEGVDCGIFHGSPESRRAATMSLSVLVVIEMFNAMNSLSENQSLLSFPLWKNKYLIGAIFLSMALHFLILYSPILAKIFGIEPLNSAEWLSVVVISCPVILLDEALKVISRRRAARFRYEKVKGQ